jgi:hypothetical protein
VVAVAKARGPDKAASMSMKGEAAMYEFKRVTALIGPYGSGKTELSIGLARLAARLRVAQGSPFAQVALADLDVLKPYFRSRETGDRMKYEGVGVIAPQGAMATADLPIITPELRGSVARQDVLVVLDVGGDPVGARALGSISDVVKASEYDLLLVLNQYRPFMNSVDGVVAQATQMAAAAHLDITGIISNTHLLDDTEEADVFGGLELSRAVAQKLGVSVRLLGVPEKLAEALATRPDLPPIVAIRRHMMPEFLGGVVLASRSHSPLQGSS